MSVPFDLQIHLKIVMKMGVFHVKGRAVSVALHIELPRPRLPAVACLAHRLFLLSHLVIL